MNKFLFLLACGLFMQGLTKAQTDPTIKRDTTITYNDDKYSVFTNRFFDNWYVTGGAGFQVYFGDHNKQMKFSEKLTPNYEINIGKWFTPGVGVRLGVNGFKIKGVTQNGAHSTGERYDGKPWEGYWLYNKEFNYYHLHGDVLFNLSNILAGYKENRFYTISPYVGLGWMVSTDEPIEREISANLGVFNTFRLSNAFDLTLDVRGGMVNDRFDGEIGGRRNEGILSTHIGVAYKFNKRKWEKSSTTIISYDEAILQNLRDKVAQLAADNDALRKQLQEAGDKTITEIKVEQRILAAPILVTFPINSSNVSNEARVNLGFFAKTIREGNSDIVYKVTGYADKGTGTPTINDRLSKARAEAIYQVLVREFGVSPSQLEISHEGGVENMYYNDPRLSRAVITIAK